MKRIGLFILLFLGLFLNVEATSVKEKWISGLNEVKTGNEISLGFYMTFDDVKRNTVDTNGVLLVVYELIFDDDVFTVTSISSETNEWDSSIYIEDGKYYVLSTVSDDNPLKNKCIDNVLFCGNYNATIKFYVKDTDKKTSSIKIGETQVGMFKIKEDGQYNVEDIIEVDDNFVKGLDISIEKTESIITYEPESIVQEDMPDTEKIIPTTKKVESTKETTKVTTTITKEDVKSKGYLKYLEIENYKINFRKYKYNYNITVDKDVNELKIKTETEDELSSYEIIGADNLKESGYKVLIEVTSNEEDVTTYTINVKIKENNEIIKKLKSTFRDNKLFFIIVASVLFLIIVAIIIIKVRYNKKLDRALNNF